MIKKLALILAIVMVACLIWSLLGPAAGVTMTINGHEMIGPAGVVVGIWNMIIAFVVLCCVGILLTFVFMGVGLIILSVLGGVAFILAIVFLPFLLPLLIPIFLVWLFCVIIRKSKPALPSSR